MLVIGFPAAAFATNCYLIAAAPGEDCLVVDPGIGVLGELADTLAQHRLRPAAVLATHGHLDHIYSVTPVCGAHGVATYVHPDDRYRVTDPISSLEPALLAMLEQQFGPTRWQQPDDVRPVRHGETLQLAGLPITVLHCPGHTEGSVMFSLPQSSVGADQAAATVLSGDVLFAGSIGRTDLAGGDHAAMQRSLREQVLPLPDDTVVLPGHGPATTIGRERTSNPYLTELRPA